MDQTHIAYIDADDARRQRIAEEWGETATRHMHSTDGFSILALYNAKQVGLSSVHCRSVTPPLDDTHENDIDTIEVVAGFRRRGIATSMIELSDARAPKRGVHQLRARSSEGKTEALPMWKALGCGPCPATTIQGASKSEVTS
jgi:GNAT superfamily N-acetyltransferase